MPDTAPTPQFGDYVDVIYHGVLRTLPDSDDDIVIEHSGTGEWQRLPENGVVHVVEPPEPTVISTIVTGWTFPDDVRPAAMNVFVLTSTDGDGDGHACWQAPGGEHEYRWPAVAESTKHGRRVIGPPPS